MTAQAVEWACVLCREPMRAGDRWSLTEEEVSEDVMVEAPAHAACVEALYGQDGDGCEFCRFMLTGFRQRAKPWPRGWNLH